MPRRNRVDPWGDLHAVAGRGLFTGNRGCIVDDAEQVVRHHASGLWITCVTTWGERRYPLARPNRWTPIFFLDDAVALAAGHRPCGYCRRDDYRAYRDAVTAGLGRADPLLASELDRLLVAERLRRGRGIDRAGDRKRWTAPHGELPDGAVVVVDDAPHLVIGKSLRPFGFDGWGPPIRRPRGDRPGDVLTPPTSVLALRHGFRPVLSGSVLPNVPNRARWEGQNAQISRRRRR